MADKITIGLDDQTDGGADSIMGRLDAIGDAADNLSADLDQVASNMDDVGDASKRVETDSVKAADKGKSSFNAMNLKIIALNQALELSKKVIGAVSQTVNALADSGSPAFVKLKTEVDNVYKSLLQVADDPAIQSWVDEVSQKISSDLIPTIKGIPDALRETGIGANILLLQIKENLGLIRKGASETYGDMTVLMGKVTDAAKEQIAAQRSEIAITEKLAELRSKVAADAELKNLAAIESERTIIDLIGDETDELKDREKAGTADAKSREAGLRKIELLERRLAELPAIRAQKEIKAQEEASQARHANVEAFNANMKAMAEQNAGAAKAIVDAAIEKAKQASAELLKLIEEAKGPDGKNVVDAARGSLSPKQIRDQLVRQAQEEARQKVIDDGQDDGKVDQFGKAIGNTTRERAAAQRALERQQDVAARQAGANAFKDFNSGKTGGSDIVGAGNALIEASATTANANGQFGSEMLGALRQALNNDQQAAMQLEQNTQQIQQLRQGLGQVNGNLQNTRNRAQRGGFKG